MGGTSFFSASQYGYAKDGKSDPSDPALLAKRVDGLVQRVAQLESALRTAEQRLALVKNNNLADAYRGTYDPADGDFFNRGQLVTHQGSLWLCMSTGPEGAPGSSPDWKLIVKRGKDAKGYR